MFNDYMVKVHINQVNKISELFCSLKKKKLTALCTKNCEYAKKKCRIGANKHFCFYGKTFFK